MSETVKHTPTPWTIDEDGPDYVVRGSDGDMLLCDTSYYPSAPNREDADFIVRAVNAHNELVAALTNLLACPAIADVDHNDPDWGDGETAEAVTFACAALSKASANSIEER